MILKILYNAQRQYRHNNDVGFIAAYDLEETNKVVEKLESELNRAQSRIEELETALTESTQKLEKACSVLERANALTETQARIIRRLVDENLEES